MIKKAGIEDLLDIVALDRECAIEEAFAFQRADSIAAWRVWIEHALVYKAISSEGKCLGVVVAFSVNKQGWHLHKLLLQISETDTAIRKALLNTLLEKIDRREDEVSAVVAPDADELLSLYASYGFVIRHLEENYLGYKQRRYLLFRPKNWVDAA